MKKITLALGVFVGTFFVANAQCTIEPDSIPTGQLSHPDTLPCVVQNEAYSQIVQFKIPSTVDPAQLGYGSLPIPVTVTVDSIVVTGASGLPNGITATWNPASGVFPGGSNGCFLVAGTTGDPAGHYPITLIGTATVMVNASPFFNGDTTVPLSMLSQAGANSPFNMALDVIEQGQTCRPVSGIATLNSFNAIINVFPNPATNVLNVNINTVDRINGSISIFDMLGRVVYTENVDYLGVINKQINVANFGKGIYNLQITNNKNAYKTKFVVE